MSSRFRSRALFLAGLLACGLSACGSGDPPPPTWQGGGPAVCEDGAREPSWRRESQATLGPSANAIRRFGDAIYIVESGSNTISKLSVDHATLDPGFVDVGNERGPWDVWADAEEIWITNYSAGTVTLADAHSGEVLDEILHPSFRGPSGIAATSRHVYVSSVDFRGQNRYGTGTVTVLDRASRTVVGTIETAQKNPQYVEVVDTAEGRRIVVVDSGAIALEDGQARAASDAAVEIWREGEDPMQPEREIFELPLTDGVGTPGRPMYEPESRRIYLPSATSPVLFVLDSEAGRWQHGADDPLRFGDDDQNALHHAALHEQIIYLTSFNQDALYLFDTRCDALLAGPIALEDSDLLAGPHGVVPLAFEDRVEAWYVLSIANELGRVHLKF